MNHNRSNKRDHAMETLYADNALIWPVRLAIYRRIVSSFVLFFVAIAILNVLRLNTRTLLWAATELPIALILSSSLIWNRPWIRGATLIAILLLALFTQAVNSIDEPYGLFLMGTILVTMARLGWFRGHAIAKLAPLVPITIAVVVVSSTEYFVVQPDVEYGIVSYAIGHILTIAMIVYHVFCLTWLPNEYTRRRLFAAELERDIYQHELNQSQKPIPRHTNTITSHLDQIDAMAAEDLPLERSQCYLAHTNAVRNKLAHFVRKYIIEPVSTSSYRSRR